MERNQKYSMKVNVLETKKNITMQATYFILR